MKTTSLKLGNVLVVVGILIILGVAGRGDFDGESLSMPMSFWQIIILAALGLGITALGLLAKK